MVVEKPAPHVRDLVHLLAFDVFRDHESLVFKPLQRGIHRARGRRIAAMQLLFQLLHHLVAGSWRGLSLSSFRMTYFMSPDSNQRRRRPRGPAQKKPRGPKPKANRSQANDLVMRSPSYAM